MPGGKYGNVDTLVTIPLTSHPKLSARRARNSLPTLEVSALFRMLVQTKHHHKSIVDAEASI
jgi:hypothetical protein